VEDPRLEWDRVAREERAAKTGGRKKKAASGLLTPPSHAVTTVNRAVSRGAAGPSGEAVGGEVEAAEHAQRDAGARVTQPELDVGEVWRLRAHRPVYRPRPRNLDRP
jgi:hypothetical protein